MLVVREDPFSIWYKIVAIIVNKYFKWNSWNTYAIWQTYHYYNV